MIVINTDGGARGNPGPGAIGIVIRRDGRIIEKIAARVKGNVTNNVAEYAALIRALEIVSQDYEDKEITCFLDSELIVNQLLGKYRVRNKLLLKLFLRVQELQEHFDKIVYQHVKRKDPFQKIADYLLNQELDKWLGERKVINKK
ncbi:MAG: ribonuclease HI family protein [Nanoarchaeota archaeon]|nr:ribonuclease HI family protein [Nanoarchaeota archaeon]